MAVIGRFPEHELAIRRLCSQDAGFMDICEDFEDAARALRHWEEAGPAHDARASEYHDMLGEIEADILEDLSTHLRHGPRSTGSGLARDQRCTQR